MIKIAFALGFLCCSALVRMYLLLKLVDLNRELLELERMLLMDGK